MFRPVRQVTEPVGHQTTLFGRVRQGGDTGDDVCCPRLHLVHSVSFVWLASFFFGVAWAGRSV